MFAVVAVAFLLGACAGVGRTGPGSSGTPGGSPSTEPSPTPSGIAHPTGASDLVLRVEFVGGLIAPPADLVRVPSFSLFGDGRLVTEGAQTEIYPQPALPALLVQQLTEDGVQRILELAGDAGLLGRDATYVNGGVADAPTTVFTVNADGGHHVVQASALGFGDEVGVPESDRAARRVLVRFQGELTDLASALPANSFTGAMQYEPEGLRLFVTEGAPFSDPGVDQKDIAWPLATPLSSFGAALGEPGSQPVRCGTVEGDDLARLMPSVERATQISPWTSGGAAYGIVVRPLLPDESGCPR
jgi:hypothetical protein